MVSRPFVRTKLTFDVALIRITTRNNIFPVYQYAADGVSYVIARLSIVHRVYKAKDFSFKVEF